MGLNIFAYIVEDREEGDYGDKWLKKQSFIGFDEGRHTGDRELAATDEIEWDTIHDNPDFIEDVGYSRPKDIDKAIEWVLRQDLLQGNKDRLIGLFEAMRSDTRLRIYFSY